MPPHPRPPPRAPCRAARAALLLAGAAATVGCGDGGEPVGPAAREPVAGLWEATSYRLRSAGAADPVALAVIETGGMYLLEIFEDLRYRETLIAPTVSSRLVEGRAVVEGDTLTLRAGSPAGFPPQTLRFRVHEPPGGVDAAVEMSLDGRTAFDFDGDGAPEEATVQAVLRTF